MALLASIIGAATLAAAAPSTNPCIGLRDLGTTAAPRPVGMRDLIELTDIGGSDSSDVAGVFGLSPDMKQVAFVTRRANPDVNGYCQRLMIVAIDGTTPPQVLDQGGELIRTTSTIWSIAALPQGAAMTIAPRWSPDGQRIAYARKDHGSTQVWIAALAGGPARQVTHLESDIEDLAWSRDGKALILAHRPGIIAADKAIAREGLKGWLYDDSFSPMEAKHPWARSPIPTVHDRFDLETGTLVPAAGEDLAAFDPSADPNHPATAQLSARDAQGNRAWVEPVDSNRYWPPTKLTLLSAQGQRWSCSTPACARIQHVWWSRPGRLIFMGRQGWGLSETGLYSWQLGEAQPRQIFSTRDAVISCVMATPNLICAQEKASTPRMVVSIDTQSGQRRPLYDPNRNFLRLPLGSVQRFLFKNAYGIESWADLVLPPDHRSGQKHPLVLVQYRSRGFLRGGTGDEVPIQVLASRGFAVLSFERPTLFGIAKEARSELEFRQINHADFMDRRSVFSSMQEAIRLAIATGAIDSAHMGISGFSDGTANTQFALINSKLFSVASLGACCEEQIMQPLVGGPGYENYQRTQGYPAFDDISADARAYWSVMSLRQNADRLDTPILAQIGDSEYIMGLDVAVAWRERGKPFELYVFPDDTHWKWQPAHRLAMYDRVSDWFTFWLMGKADCDPAKTEQYTRWRKMKGAPDIPTSNCPASLPVP